MDLIDYLRRQFAYDHWANGEVLRALQSGDAASARSLQLLAHVLSAEQLWLERLRQRPPSLPVWPEFNLARCEIQLAELNAAWLDYLDQLAASALSEKVAYKNSKGEAFTSRIQDVLTHVLMHSAYHRGQIATEMRGRGHTPAYTDFIHAVRQGFIE
ncbi:MAG TPA: DinB family protein [Candidatus Aquilonibacter sp.]|nr:DinB family protein [Candidatus Aquilonibacter sp.]